MRRVVVTGMGIWSCIGQDLKTVTESLRQGRSGIVFDPKRIEYGLQSGLVGNVPRPDLKPLLPRKFRATMSEDAEYAYMAARQAFEQAGIDDEYLLQNEVGCIWGSDGNPYFAEVGKIMDEEHDSTLVEPQAQFKGETSSVSMNLATIFHLKGIGLSIGAACASSSHAIGIGKMLIQKGTQEMILVGGSCELSNTGLLVADIMNLGAEAHSINVINEPRPFDVHRTGMVPSGGAAALLLEDYEHAIERGAEILVEVSGYGFYSACNKISYHPNSEGIIEATINALDDAKITMNQLGYINPCASGSLLDDNETIKALNILEAYNSKISSTESITGHENWMTGVGKLIYNILMMQNDFIAPNINLNSINEDAQNLNIIKETKCTQIENSLVITAGLGGSCCAIILGKV